MKFPREWMEQLIYGGQMASRFTQDSPILPDVWIEYSERHEALDLLITPHLEPGPNNTTPGRLSIELRKRLESERSLGATEGFELARRDPVRIAYNQSTVRTTLWFDELVRVVLPMSRWWSERVVQTGIIALINQPQKRHQFFGDENLLKAVDDPGMLPLGVVDPIFLDLDREHKEALRALKSQVSQIRINGNPLVLTSDVLWMFKIVGTIAAATRRCLRKPTAADVPPEVSPTHAKGRGKGKKAAAEESWPPPPWPRRDATKAEIERHRAARRAYVLEIVESVIRLLDGIHMEKPGPRQESACMVWSVSLNRRAQTTVMRSRVAVKADAATRVFDVSCNDLVWAVIDSGIDAEHPAFRIRKDRKDIVPPSPADEYDPGHAREYLAKFSESDGTLQSRVLETYDFTRIQYLLSYDQLQDEASLPDDLRKQIDALRAGAGGARKRSTKKGKGADGADVDFDHLKSLKRSLLKGQDVEWELLIPFIQVPHTQPASTGQRGYVPPKHEHGTHVAGILAADWGDRARGICPDLRLIDLRVLDDQGLGDEFNVIAALQFIRHLKSKRDFVSVHGANLSMAIRHDVANYACGRTPVCDECERLVGNGIVVVAAAGNEGYTQYLTPKGPQDTYHSISITDPGNADGVITVGSTHRFMPHTYGVSYFSSRGPTGDGRLKPDLVAPGEKIEAPVPGEDSNLRRMDGTSMAAPHVSGAAALLIARHRELAGQPVRIKQILCATATDLGRERYFQGHGMVDILRALQSV
jgi:serine protease AprX